MSKSKTQIKFTIDSDSVSTFKAECMAEGVSMASVINQWMKGGRSAKAINMKMDTRPHRKKSVREIIGLLEGLLQNEERYRDAIPEKFQTRYEVADEACEQLSQAIACLEDAF